MKCNCLESNEESAGHVAVNVLQGGWDAIGSMLAIQLVKWWCRVQGVFRADSAEAFTSTLLRWPSTLKCIATRLPASYVTPLSVVEPTCDVTCVWNITCNGKKRSRSSAARKTNWTRKFFRTRREMLLLAPPWSPYVFLLVCSRQVETSSDLFPRQFLPFLFLFFCL